ncbi:ABC transporter ATP-binding protein [Desulfosediminicola flagellatus]|uniref:ABC transporter ATP-binding protein n=1 Tax=Desulfosediminicola flagellatus TaxID=2569541 RepID=UPI0010AD5F4D|nr:ABC transporter ATP-binding protein [Desulfosediminicola flagellatus]
MFLKATDISRSYALGGRQVHALEKVSLEVAESDFLIVTGPSGSGKSTLLNILSGFDHPTTGDVEYKGNSLFIPGKLDVARVRNSSFGFIYQTPHLIADKTVLENVALAFHYGEWVERKEVERRCSQLLDYVGLGNLIDRHPATLSGGEMQRVVFARALAREPDIIFADEPTGSLDENNSKNILGMLKQQTRQGRAVVMVTHEADAISYGTSYLSLQKARAGVSEVSG